jgi:arylsulfatase A-like enzyme
LRAFAAAFGRAPPPSADRAANAGRGGGARPKAAAKARKEAKADDGTWGFGNFRIGPTSRADEQMPDHGTVSYCLKQLARKHDRPFFLACGITKPHLPFVVPRKYFDLHPLDGIQLPPFKKDDLDDVPPAGIKFAKPDGDHKRITEAGKWKEVVQAYRASISFCDAMVGRLLDGLEKSAFKDNTVIVLWSDHGWHLGEKLHWRKFALWEEATRSPLIWVVPGVTKPRSVCERTVDLMTIYPTLCDVCGVPAPKHLQGASIKGLLADPKAKWDSPAITTYRQDNHAIRTERWRYIRYANGDEELYDHDADPHEWTNLAKDARHASVKKELAKWLPKENRADPVRKRAR